MYIGPAYRIWLRKVIPKYFFQIFNRDPMGERWGKDDRRMEKGLEKDDRMMQKG
jgi:hypothetical protein